MRLYKYCPPARVDILESGMIALTRPRAFNDPFELMPNISQFDNWLEMGNHVEEITRHFVVLSLAENKDSLLMWAHYTDSYRGFLIGLEGPEASSRPNLDTEMSARSRIATTDPAVPSLGKLRSKNSVSEKAVSGHTNESGGLWTLPSQLM